MTKLIVSILLVSVMFLITKHPLSLVLILIINTAVMALYSGMLNKSYWYSFMLFMIMIGGMLVLIMYMTSVAANEMMSPPQKMMILGTIIVPLMLLLPNSITTSIFMTPADMNEIQEHMKIISLNKYISPNHINMIIMLINYLLVTLIAIVKITDIKHGTLRQKF